MSRAIKEKRARLQRPLPHVTNNVPGRWIILIVVYETGDPHYLKHTSLSLVSVLGSKRKKQW